MATARKPAPKRASEMDAITLLKADHDKVRDLFKQFEELMDKEGAEDQKGMLAQKICNELKIHSQIEEEIFYPTVRAAIDDDDLMDEADVEHEAVNELVEQIEAMRSSDDLYDAKVVVLGEQVEHHATEEEDEMFPQVKKAKIDIVELGMEMQERKRALMAEMGIEDESDDMSAPEHTKKKSKLSQGRALS